MEKHPIILDTDIGTDVDDAWALTLALALPGIDIVGVTVTYGSKEQLEMRGSIALRLLALAGRTDIPVVLGEPAPMQPAPPVYMNGHEGKGILTFDASDLRGFHEQPVKSFISEMAQKHEGRLVVVGVGPLTNLAAAFDSDPNLKNRLRHVTFMGGGYREFRNRTEHNFKCDPAAAAKVLRSGAKLRMIGYNVTERTSVRWDALRKIVSAPKAYARTLQTLTDVFVNYRIGKRQAKYNERWTDSLQRWLEHPETRMNDPLILAALVNPDLVEFEETTMTLGRTGKVEIDPETIAKRNWSVTIPMARAVKLKEFKEFLHDRIKTFFARLPD